MIDVLVMLCAKYHLNPSDHTVELLTHNKNHVCFKPNSLIGSLEADTIVLKPKVAEDKARRPYTPEVNIFTPKNFRIVCVCVSVCVFPMTCIDKSVFMLII